MPELDTLSHTDRYNQPIEPDPITDVPVTAVPGDTSGEGDQWAGYEASDVLASDTDYSPEAAVVLGGTVQATKLLDHSPADSGAETGTDPEHQTTEARHVGHTALSPTVEVPATSQAEGDGEADHTTTNRTRLETGTDTIA